MTTFLRIFMFLCGVVLVFLGTVVPTIQLGNGNCPMTMAPIVILASILFVTIGVFCMTFATRRFW